MKKLLLLLALFVQTIITYSQESTSPTPISRSTFYLEFLGTGGIYSLNYDRILYKKNSFGIAGRIGFTYVPVIKGVSDISSPGASIEITGLLGKKNGNFEFGLGGTYLPVYNEENSSILLVVPRIGYRNQKPNGGLFYRAAFTPWIPFMSDQVELETKFEPMIGISIGYTLKK